MIQGNDFKLVIPLTKSGNRVITISKSILRDLRGKEYPITTNVGNSEITAKIAADLLPSGRYGLELKGTLGAAKFRRFISEAVTISVEGDDDFECDSEGLPIEKVRGITL